MVLDFNRDWTFYKYGEEDSQKNVNLPHDAMVTEPRGKCLNGANSGYFPGGRYIYQKKFTVTNEQLGKYIGVFFEGVYRCATIYLNEEKVGYHAYGYTEFTVDISDKVKAGENVLKVDADNSLEPNSRWYSGSGIYRPVSLIIRDKNHMSDVKVKTLCIHPAVVSVTCNQEAEVEIFDGDQCVATGKTGEITIENAKLWSAETPHLYKAVLKTETDEQEVTFGIRTLTWSADTGVLVNDEEVKFRGACIHHDNGVLGACEFDDAAERRIRILKEGGYNAIRSSHHPCSNALLRACDKLGMYIMDESFDMWYTPKTHHDYARDFYDNYKDDIAAMIAKDYNHPAVVMYSIGNECSEPHEEKGMQLAKEQADYMKSLDDTRITTMGANLMLMNMKIYKDDGAEYKREPLNPEDNKDLMAKMDSTGSSGFNMVMGMLPKIMSKASGSRKCVPYADQLSKSLDILGLNYGTARYDKDLSKNDGRIYVGAETFSHGIYENWNLVKKYKSLVGDFVWTGWDYLGEAGSCGAWDYIEWGQYPLFDGAGTIDAMGHITPQDIYMQISYGTYTKPYIAVRPVTYAGHKFQRGAWRMTNAIRSWSWQGCEGTRAEIEVYADADKVELFLNGKSLGKKKLKENKTLFKASYQPGTLSVKAYDATGSVVGEDELSTAGETTKLTVEAEKRELLANGQDLSYLNIYLTDENGVVQPAVDKKVTVTVDGSEDVVSLAGLGSARTRTDEVFDKNYHDTHFGKALAVLRAGYTPGKVKVTVSCEGMEDVVVDITVK